MSVPTPAKRDSEGLTRAERLDMMLEIFRIIATPGKEYGRREIAAAVGISAERVRQIEEGAMRKLRREAVRRRKAELLSETDQSNKEAVQPKERQ